MIDTWKSLIEKRLEELIPSSKEPLFDAVRYSLLSPGKRLRPLLTLASASLFADDPLPALDPACAIEMIHAYSLIHDDLPCMDDDDLRRGKPSLHKAYDEGMALLTGDYLLTRAFDILSHAPHLTDTQKIALIQTVSKRAGAPGMIGGQAIDISSQGKAITPETLIQMHLGKTGALLTACLECGAIAANAPASTLPLLRSIGEELGLAYQFLDDLLDATATTATLGKPAGSDASKNKPTAITLFGLDGTKKRLKTIEGSLFKKLKQLPQKNSELSRILVQLLQKKN
jgi:geranylgeranyl pyrophosphate synthase